MILTPAHTIRPGDHVLGIDRGEVLAVERREDKVRFQFTAGFVVKDADEDMAVKGE